MNTKMTRNSYSEREESISITKARSMLTKFPEQLNKEHGAIALTRRGKPVMALLAWDLYEAIVETLEIMEDAGLMAALRLSIKEASEGKVIPWEEVKAELGL
jgi:PHD/YefM family antitoxin component YafN of YafNO toxin-antitoxin module